MSPVKPPAIMMPFPVGPKPPRVVLPKDFTPPAYKEDSPGAADAVNSLIEAMRTATVGPYKNKFWKTEDNAAATEAILSAIEAADAAGADPEKLRVAAAVVEFQALPEKADRFW